MPYSRLWLVVGLALVGLVGMLGLSGCGGTATTGPLAMHSTVAVEITPIPLFSPGLIVISAGDTVKWTNNDLYIHAPVADAGNPVPGGPDAAALFPNGIPSGQSYTWVSPADVPSGTRWYYHDLYNGLAGDGVQMGSGMTGVIIVR